MPSFIMRLTPQERVTTNSNRLLKRLISGAHSISWKSTMSPWPINSQQNLELPRHPENRHFVNLDRSIFSYSFEVSIFYTCILREICYLRSSISTLWCVEAVNKKCSCCATRVCQLVLQYHDLCTNSNWSIKKTSACCSASCIILLH